MAEYPAMIIFYGSRAYGRVDGHGGEHAQTSFAHVYYMPLFPLQSHWITDTRDGSTRGFQIRAHGKSILATYLRMWGPVVAVACLASGDVAAMLVGAAFAALTVWAWTWRRGRASRRSDFNLVAYGSRCEPRRMTTGMRAQLKTALDARWERLALGRPPDDVAQYGAKNLDEAATAYGLLRLAGVERRDATAHAAADRIAAGTYEAAPDSDGPYRADHHDVVPGAVDPTAAAAVLAQVQAVAAAHGAERGRVETPWWQLTRPKVVLACLLAVVGAGGILATSPSLGSVAEPSPEQLDGTLTSRAHERFVHVTCTAVQPAGEFDNHDKVFGCDLGDRVLLILSSHEITANTEIVGKLEGFDDNLDRQWPDDLRHNSLIFGNLLVTSSLAASRASAIACILGETGLVALFLFALARTSRRRRATR